MIPTKAEQIYAARMHRINALYNAAVSMLDMGNLTLDMCLVDCRLVLDFSMGLYTCYLLLGDTHILESRRYLRTVAYAVGDDSSARTALLDAHNRAHLR